MKLLSSIFFTTIICFLGNSYAQDLNDSTSLVNDLSRLAEMHQQGILTDDQFTAAKNQLLGVSDNVGAEDVQPNDQEISSGYLEDFPSNDRGSQSPVPMETQRTTEDKEITETTPARFGNRRENFIERLSELVVPEETEIVVRCEASIWPQGDIPAAYCPSITGGEIDKEKLDEIALFVQEQATKLFRISPAVVADFRSGVIMPFAVIIRNTGNNVDIKILENQLYNSGVFGENYFAAQLRGNTLPQCRYAEYGVVLLTISATGSVLEIKDASNSLSERCLNRLERLFDLSSSYGWGAFIPAFYNGEAVKSSRVMVLNGTLR